MLYFGKTIYSFLLFVFKRRRNVKHTNETSTEYSVHAYHYKRKKKNSIRMATIT